LVTGPDLAALSHVRLNLPPIAVLCGRSLALCAHPYAAWRTHSRRGRLGVLLAYLAASYAVTLGVLSILFALKGPS
jgi:hypothetical protein